MKGFIQRHVWLSAVVGFVLALAMGSSAVFAAQGWSQISLTTTATGSFTITSPPLVTPDFTYTVDTNVLNFGTSGTVAVGKVIGLTSSPITITYGVTCNQTINSLSISNIVYPSGLTNPSCQIDETKTATGMTFEVVIMGTAVSTAGTYDLSGFSCTITPN